jgi:hypothetical protein
VERAAGAPSMSEIHVFFSFDIDARECRVLHRPARADILRCLAKTGRDRGETDEGGEPAGVGQEPGLVRRASTAAPRAFCARRRCGGIALLS